MPDRRAVRAKKTIAFRVALNGDEVATAGIPGVHVVSVILTSVARDPRSRQLWPEGVTFNERELTLEVAGLATHQDGGHERVNWGSRALVVGDRLSVDVVDSARPSAPVQRRKHDRVSIETAERRQLAQLKRKYEGTASSRASRGSDGEGRRPSSR